MIIIDDDTIFIIKKRAGKNQLFLFLNIV